MSTDTSVTFEKPDWARVSGQDEFGRFADLVFKGITQRFRWIEPGSSLMGSPESEPGRFGDETQHPVTLTQGFWLADTACTQGLWQEVMGDNPSAFQDPLNPVEQVSWDETQLFCAKLNDLVPGLNVCLPTEAWWEYACRAGTSTPFSFGENISPGQANFDDREIYSSGQPHGYRAAPVKSFPPNPWGLFEMHGNVWEWCQDRYGEYGAGPHIDPRGPPTGECRVLRGGSWYSLPRFVRSTTRGRSDSTRRNYGTGFRLARISPCPLNTVPIPTDAQSTRLSDETLLRLWEAAARDTNEATILEFARRVEAEVLRGK